MGLIRFGDHIELLSQKCNIPNLTPDDISGINRDKEFFEPSRQVGEDTSNYKYVPTGYFACNLMHVGRDVVLPIALNTTEKTKVVSPAYTIFKLKTEDELLSKFLFMLLKSDEKDRFFWFHCDSSVRDGMDWDAFCDIELDLPSIEIQRKYVAIYEGLLANLHSYESKLEELKLVCDGYIEDLRKKYVSKSLFSIMTKRNERNDDLNAEYVGISNNGFIKPKQDLSEGNILNKKKFYKGDFIFTPSGVNLYNNIYNSAVCSHVNEMYYCKDSNVSSNYIELWLKRSEFFRYCDFFNISSVMSNFDGEALKQYKIPIPPLEIQNSIVEVFNVYNERKEYVTRLKNIIKDICPILVRGAIKEASEVK